MRRAFFTIVLLGALLVRVEGQIVGGPNSTNLPVMTQQLPWFGTGDINVYEGQRFSQLVYFPRWGHGASRSTYAGPGPGADNTNTDTFAWSKVQLNGPDDWNWTNADLEMACLTNYNMQIGVTFFQGAYSNCPFYTSYDYNPPLIITNYLFYSGDPPWVANLTTQQYAIAKGNFVTAFVQRYSSNQWQHVTAQGVTNGLRFVEPENEPPSGSPGDRTYIRHIMVLQACQGARINGVQLIGGVFAGPNTNALGDLIARGMLNLVDGISWHYYMYSDVDPSVSMQEPYNNFPQQRVDQFLNNVYSMIPSNMAVYTDEFGLEYIQSFNSANPVLIDPQRASKNIIMVRAGGAASIDFNPSGPPAAYNTSGYGNDLTLTPTPPVVAAIWSAYWLQNRPFAGLMTSSNTFAYSFGSGTDMVTFAWAMEGTTVPCMATNYTAITDLYGNPLPALTTLTSDVVVLKGAGTINVTTFNANPNYGPPPMTVTFTDLSTGTIASRSWDFGDGSVTNTAGTSVVHQYSTFGTYVVQLTVSGPNGSSIDTQTNMVVVTPFPASPNRSGVSSGSSGDGGTGGGTNSFQTADRGLHANWRLLITY